MFCYVAVSRARLQPDSFEELAVPLFDLAKALQGQLKAAEARAGAFRSAAEQLEKTVGPDHPDTRAARQLAGFNQ